MCRHINNRSHIILINFFILNLYVNVFNLTYRLAKISFMISIASRSINFNFSVNFFSNFRNCFWNSLLHSYLSFDFDRFLYKYDVFNLLKVYRIASIIFYILANALLDTVSFRISYNLLTFSVRQYSSFVLTFEVFISDSFS